MTRQLINLVGGLATVIVLLAGIFLVALPMYSAAQTTMTDADQVAQTNQSQQSVIDALLVQEQKSTELEADLDALREQVTPQPRTDDVLQLAIAAVAEQGAVLESLSVTAAEPFTVRVDESAEAAPAPAVTPAEGDAEASDGAAAETEATSTTTPATAETDTTREQVAVTVVVVAPGVEAATSIVDALRSGPRVVAITNADTVTSDEGVRLTVTALVFVNRS